MKANQSSMRWFFGQNRLKKGLGVFNYISLHVWILALEGTQHGNKSGIIAWPC